MMGLGWCSILLIGVWHLGNLGAVDRLGSNDWMGVRGPLAPRVFRGWSRKRGKASNPHPSSHFTVIYPCPPGSPSAKTLLGALNTGPSHPYAQTQPFPSFLLQPLRTRDPKGPLAPFQPSQLAPENDNQVPKPYKDITVCRYRSRHLSVED